MGDIHEGDADLTLDALEFELHGMTKLEIEGAEGLVEQERFGEIDERTGERHPLLLAAGELGRTTIREIGQTDDLEQFGYSLGDLGLGSLAGAGTERHVVIDVHMREQGVLLEHRVDIALVGWNPGDVDTIETYCP